MAKKQKKWDNNIFLKIINIFAFFIKVLEIFFALCYIFYIQNGNLASICGANEVSQRKATCFTVLLLL